MQPYSAHMQSTKKTRRDFFASTSAALAAASLLSVNKCYAADENLTAESFVSELYRSLTPEQKSVVCLQMSDPSMLKAHPNWHVTDPLIGSDFYSKSQHAIIENIVRHVTSEDGYALLQKQMEDDDGGLDAYSIAIFGEPGEEHFQWLLTGRHLTLRADGNTMANSAFGGPIVYGHGEESSAADNLFYYQTRKVNSVFDALNTDQRQAALLKSIPGESDVTPSSDGHTAQGVAVSSMSSDQKELVQDVLKTILSPYRQSDGDEAMKIIEQVGGLDALRFAFFSEEDLSNDKIWDMWRIEGPRTLIHFRGAPHVHAYIHIG